MTTSMPELRKGVTERVDFIYPYDLVGPLKNAIVRLQEAVAANPGHGEFEVKLEYDSDGPGLFEIYATRPATEKEIAARRARGAKAREKTEKDRRRLAAAELKEYERLRTKYGDAPTPAKGQ